MYLTWNHGHQLPVSVKYKWKMETKSDVIGWEMITVGIDTLVLSTYKTTIVQGD